MRDILAHSVCFFSESCPLQQNWASLKSQAAAVSWESRGETRVPHFESPLATSPTQSQAAARLRRNVLAAIRQTTSLHAGSRGACTHAAAVRTHERKTGAPSPPGLESSGPQALTPSSGIGCEGQRSPAAAGAAEAPRSFRRRSRTRLSVCGPVTESQGLACRTGHNDHRVDAWSFSTSQKPSSAELACAGGCAALIIAAQPTAPLSHRTAS